MRRDLQDGKARVDLLLAEGVPYDEQLLVRAGGLMERGASKYGERNWEKANSQEEMNRFKASALRHLLQWYCGETDEDHPTAVIFNLIAYESTKWKLQEQERQDHPLIQFNHIEYNHEEFEKLKNRILDNLVKDSNGRVKVY